MNEGASLPRPRYERPSRHFSSPRRLLGSERGTAIVEFALIAPLLFLLVFGIVEFGRALNYYNDLTQLAGQGARAAVVSRNPDGSAVGTANADCPEPATGARTIQCQIASTYPTDSELKNGISVCLGKMDPTTKVISDPNPKLNVGDPVTVRTKFRFHFLTTIFGAAITLSSTQTERVEAAPTWQGGPAVSTKAGACQP